MRTVVPGALAAAVVALQIAYPLVAAGPQRDRLTVAIVAVFAAASSAHALLWRGARFATVLVLTTVVGGLAVEAVGVRTGVPFGAYRYLGSLGPEVLGVPVAVGLAWMMMAYPAYVVSTIVTDGLARRALIGGWALAAWDLFLDPQMVQAGHWRWEPATVDLAGIPVSNHLGWLAVATAMLLVLHAAGPDRAGGCAADDRAPLLLYCWTWASSLLAHLVFLGLPVSAVTGGAGMGVVVVPTVRAWLRTRADGSGR